MVSQNVETHWKGREGPFPLLLGPGVFSPTTTSRTLADALEITPGDTVIDVGCGSGVLSIVAAKLGAARVYGVDLSQRAVEAAKENARRLGLDHICEFRGGDLLEPVRDVQADVLIGDVSGIPDAIAAESGWFDDVPAGGPTGAELPAKFLRSIGDTLAMGGRLYLPTGTIPGRRQSPA
ncbi:MAG: methyltransferase domain-containing protein [Actinobacteria bacterium]|nr:MAG: methyltransferase domain-containing protein [Actinomycetota bacterium]